MGELRIEGLVKQFGSETVLRGVDLSVGQGEIAALLGPSGCGKTTILRCVAGFETPNKGSIEIDKRTVISHKPPAFVPPNRRGIGMVHQSYALWPHMTVEQNVAYGLSIRRLSKNDVSRRVREVLNIVELESLAFRYPSELSGGQQQRVALARSLAYRPSLLLLDEPLSNLDALLRERTRTELRILLKRLGITTLYVTHDQEEAFSIADTCYIMSKGEILQAGEPREIYLRPAKRFVAEFIGRGNLVDGEVRAASRAHITIGTPMGSITACVKPNRPPIGAAVSIYVRSSSVQLASQRPSESTEHAENSFSGTIIESQFLGDRVRKIFRANSGQILLSDVPCESPEASIAAGESCVASFAPTECHVLTANKEVWSGSG